MPVVGRLEKGTIGQVMHGRVTCGSERVATGRVSFAPIEGMAGRICAATIVDGQYHIDAQGGVPLGDYRVEVDCAAENGPQDPRKQWL